MLLFIAFVCLVLSFIVLYVVHILIFWSDIAVDTFDGLGSDVSYLGNFKNHWTELELKWIGDASEGRCKASDTISLWSQYS